MNRKSPLRPARVWPVAFFLCTLLTGVAVFFPSIVTAGPNDGVEGLNQDQQVIAARFLTFLSDMDAKFFERARDLNGGVLAEESKELNFDFADYYVRVGRGPVVEKIGRMMGKILKPTSDIQRPTVFGRYYGIDIHAKSPLMGQVHAAFVLQIYPDGSTAVGGTLNLLRGAAQDEDLTYMKEALDAVFEKHGVDGAPFRERLCNSAELAPNEKFHRKLACVGATFFGYPMMSVTEENYLFMTDIYETFIAAYMDTLERRKDQPHTDEDLAAQDAMRLNWFEDQVFGDPYSSSGITPYEVWSHAFLPPVIKF